MSDQPGMEEEKIFNFPEEPLGISAELGLGYFQGGPGNRLGPQHRYEIKQKLGYGTASTVWLAKDLIKDKFVTLKILSGYCTQMNVEHKLQELDIYQSLGSVGSEHHCSSLLDHFFQPDVDDDDGNHLCLVLDLVRCSIQDVEKCLPERRMFPLPVVKRILRDVLSALVFLHQHGVAHTDIKPENIMIATDPKFDIEQWLAQHPAKTYDPVSSAKEEETSHVSHQLPPPDVDELRKGSFIVSDLSNAQFVNRQTTDDISPLALRAPEVLLGGEWNQSVDIWALGNMVFYLLTRQALFQPRPTSLQLETFWPPELRPPEIQEALEAKERLPESVDFLLFQMVIFGVEHFPPELLRACRDSGQYFEKSGKLKRFNEFVPTPFIDCLYMSLSPLMPNEREAAAAFMKRCLQLLPSKRASAAELLQDPWLLSPDSEQ